MSEEEQPLFDDIVEDDNEETVNTNDVTNNRRRSEQNRSVTSVSDGISMNPLMKAVRQGTVSEETTELGGYDVVETDSVQRNVFHYAVSKPDMLRKLLGLIGKETFVQRSALKALHQADKDGETPIHRAARIANIKSLKLLHDYDNSLIKLKTSKRKRSVLHSAVESQSFLVVNFVLSKEPDLVKCVDNMLQSPVHYAAILKEPSIMKLLISKGSDTTLKDTNGQLAIHIAASKGLKNNVQLLLRENPDLVNVTDGRRQSPLLLAAKNGFPNVVSYFLVKNSSYKLTDIHDLTAFDWAVKNKFPEVVEVFLGTSVWKEVVSSSHYGPEGCFKVMIENMPEMAKLLLDKCVTINRGEHPVEYQITYDFFCLEETDKKTNSGPRFEALQFMVENECEMCLGHPVAVKYVNLKWRKRGFVYSLAYIILSLVFQICLMTYVTQVIGEVNQQLVINDHGGRNATERVYIRDASPPDTPKMMALRVIMLIITWGMTLNDIAQVVGLRFSYLSLIFHYYRIALTVSVMLFLLPVNQTLTPGQIGWGAVAVMLSWLNLMQLLKLVPVLGTYLILVETVFWTLIKIFTVVVIYLLSFASTFYVLLAEHDKFRNIYISLVSTFVAMMSGMDYEEYFVTVGWLPKIYEAKMIFLILFLLTMAIVVNNALIGLAVGDARAVMKKARFDKFARRAQFMIHLERSAVNNFFCLKTTGDKDCVEFSSRRGNIYQQISDLLFSGDQVDAAYAYIEEFKKEHEIEINVEDHFEKSVEIKLENLRSSLRHELQEVQDQMKQDLKELDRKMEIILEKLK